MYYIYILRNLHSRLYIGQTNDLKRRLQDHRSGNGAKYMKNYGDFELVYTEEFIQRSEAMRRERQLKGWTLAKKEALIIGDLQLLKRL